MILSIKLASPLTLEVGSFLHSAESEMVYRLTHTMIPYFNAGIYLENKAKIGKVEEVFGPINKVYFTVKPDSGVNANSFQVDDKVFIGSDKLLPLSRFTNEGKKGGGGAGGRGRGAPGNLTYRVIIFYFLMLITHATGGRGRGAPGGGRGPPGRGGRGGGFRGGPPGGRGGGGGGRVFSRGGGVGRGRGRG